MAGSSSTTRTVSPPPGRGRGVGAPAASASPGPSARAAGCGSRCRAPARSPPRCWPPLCCTMPYTVDRPRPVPLPGRLGGEERLEDAGARRLVHAGAGVAHGQSRRTGPGGRRALARMLGRRSTSAVAMVSVPPCGHGVAGVDRQVHQHLLDLAPGRRGRAPRPGVERVTTLDVLAEERPQHARRCPRRRRSGPATCGSSTCLRLKASSWRVEARGPLGRRPMHVLQSRAAAGRPASRLRRSSSP